ncbi:DEAD-box ATP-dependent RNA helicase 38 [Physcomitrium patens]|uniref:RNA helicase n=1 Tax=Physcomitrium patens TaxID=3218 RepID=A0A2K1KBR9_PHYPA|nr:DEAD-box ATP-dependent RNA helicase 38-like [Physcomitrium patens]XP_024381221.1 DEAD-box ATP-dependent RNA helicase 38-like [Physcomitrium patens]PNR51217.1 hypothetical protein PHYPA_010403 [Physcomitrium patens]|eukprot:XP_024381220.1 DEAD-box ATP-dependent RNA helicase 38-like [Physcomitrella patens]
MAESEAVMKVEDTSAASKATEPTPSKKDGDAETENIEELEMKGLKIVENVDDIVDEPGHIKSEELIEPETIKKVVADDTPYTSAKSFEDLNLSQELLQGLYSEMKFEKPSKIQAATLPMIVSPPYQNLIAQAHNGSGKTTCFVLGMLSRIDPQLKAPQALCVCPTRELVNQNEEVVTRMGRYTGITTASTATVETPSHLYSSRREKIVDQLVIGTPGTLKRWITKDKALDTRNIKILVFDEADQMFDQDGFQDDSLRLWRDINRSGKSCQVLLFSATFSEKVKSFAMKTIPKANYIFVEKEQLSLDVIRQYQIVCPDSRSKIDVLKNRIFPAAEKLGQSIIFVRTRGAASELHKCLEEDGHKCTSIQGGLTHEERDRVIKEFRAGETKILIATDVLARGFDQAQVTLVVNYDIPVKNTSNRHAYAEPDYETYLHRIGRSGRFGRKGAAFNLLVTQEDKRIMRSIEQHFNRNVPEVAWDNEEGIEHVLKDAGLA